MMKRFLRKRLPAALLALIMMVRAIFSFMKKYVPHIVFALVGGIINVCTGQPQSLADRVEQFLREKQYKIRLDYGAFPDRPYDSPGVWGDPAQINAILQDAGLQ